MLCLGVYYAFQGIPAFVRIGLDKRVTRQTIQEGKRGGRNVPDGKSDTED